MTVTNSIIPGMTINIDEKIYRVESCMKIKTKKEEFLIKTKLRDLITNEIVEKNFITDEQVKEVTLKEQNLEYLYPEGSQYLFLDIDNLEQVLISSQVLGEKINYLKEGVRVKALFYGSSVFSVELPTFLELMIVKTIGASPKIAMTNSTKKAILETGAKIDVPSFIEVGDIIKVDTQNNEYVQRI